MNSEPEVLRYINGGQPFDAHTTRKWMSENAEWSWVARLSNGTEAGSFVGFFAIRPTGPAERELGYRLPERLWRGGYATEGSAALVDHAFGHLGVARVWAQTMTVNTGSRRVMEKAGLLFVGMLDLEFDEPIDGSEFGDVEYALDASTWASARARGEQVQ